MRFAQTSDLESEYASGLADRDDEPAAGISFGDAAVALSRIEALVEGACHFANAGPSNKRVDAFLGLLLDEVEALRQALRPAVKRELTPH